jgi:hypothetical protein
MTRLAGAQPFLMAQSFFVVGQNDSKIAFLPTLRVARTEINVACYMRLTRRPGPTDTEQVVRASG